MSACERVIAIDPGALRSPIPPKVEHIQQRAEDCAPALLARGLRASCFVCDMNTPPGVTVDVLMLLLPMLLPGATVILTFKNFVGSKANMQREVEVATARLDTVLAPKTARVLRLMSGGKEEYTAVGRIAVL